MTTTNGAPAEGTVPADLAAFLAEPRDSREYRRAMAVKLALQGIPYPQVGALLDVTPSFVCQVKQRYLQDGVDGLTRNYHGAKPLLDQATRAAVITWLQTSQQWSLLALKQHLEQTYQVVFQSKQSSYDLLAEAGLRYKKTQAINPKQDPAHIVAKKTTS
jgi:putative transposase